MPRRSTGHRGPRGGTTTVTPTGLRRKTLWIDEDLDEALRKAAYEERKSESEIMREALRERLDVEG